jgi:hypothetical protein
MSKHVGDPTPRSPADVLRDRGYRTIVNDLGWGPHGGYRVYLVVFHTGTETYWEAIYDSANVDQPTSWVQVVPKIVKRTEYQRICP